MQSLTICALRESFRSTVAYIQDHDLTHGAEFEKGWPYKQIYGGAPSRTGGLRNIALDHPPTYHHSVRAARYPAFKSPVL
jgi:hypothetical protein